MTDTAVQHAGQEAPSASAKAASGKKRSGGKRSAAAKSSAKSSTKARAARSTADSAAIFDFDRTLIPGASGPILQRHLHEAGLGQGDLSILEPFMRFYERAGESWIQMQFARLAAPASRGWSVEAVEAAAAAAAEELDTRIQPYARHLFEEHRAAGRRLVLASTTPEPLLAPLARRLGLDDVVGTRWAMDGDRYAGTTDGGLCWGRAKLLAVRRWA